MNSIRELLLRFIADKGPLPREAIPTWRDFCIDYLRRP